MRLFTFQIAAANQISNRYIEYSKKPNVTRRGGSYFEEPFIQILQSITGSGKTPMLARAISDMRPLTKEEPLVLWISKGRVVVDQTATNFRSGGKYSDIVEGIEIRTLADVNVAEILDEKLPLIATSTVAAFNQDDVKSELNVYKVDRDRNGISIWDALKRRSAATPLFVVYDEGHNSTDKQIDKLLELKPKAILLASATMEMPPILHDIATNQGYQRDIVAIRENKNPVVTSVDTKFAVDNELVKSGIDIGGRSSIDDYIIDEMFQKFAALQPEALAETPPITLRCIYVTPTNAAEGYNTPDDPSVPFNKRKARPIVIWRYLTEQRGVDPAKIAVYCDLRVRNPPKEFRLFRGGDKDYAAFIAGNFEHIIFNLSLQEGWDDPECYFAYIDKEMGSRRQITQVIGRVLRQPNAKYSSVDDLNTAHFYIRLTTKQEFKEVLKDIRSEIQGIAPGLRITSTVSRDTRLPDILRPKKKLTLPKLAAERDAASREMLKVLNRFPTYQDASAESQAKGQATNVRLEVETGEIKEGQWHTKGPGQPIIIGKYLKRKLQERSPSAAEVIDLSSKRKFLVQVEFGSPACEQADQAAEELGSKYEQYVEIVVSNSSPYEIPAYQPRSNNTTPFHNAIHGAYDGLNSEEEEFCTALSKTGWWWTRNPSQTGYYIPLPISGPSRKFYPDFIAFTEDKIWLIDTKGGHLLRAAILSKLLNIKTPSGQPEICVAIVSKGHYDVDGKPETNEGFTLYRARSGNPRSEYFDTYDDCVMAFVGRKPRARPK